MARHIQYLLLTAFVLCLAGCKKEAAPPPAPTPVPAPAPAPQVSTPAAESVSVASITLGKAIGADKKVTGAADTFAKTDAIYAAVETAGTGHATIKAKWTFQNGDRSADVSEASETIVATGPVVSTFHVSKPSGWPPGDYQVEIFLSDKSAGSKKFTVK